MEDKLQILIVEDVATDAELICMELEQAEVAFDSYRVETKDSYLKKLSEITPDIILSDFSLPNFNAVEALKLKNKHYPGTPFILVTGAQSEEIAVDCIKMGADDYILKSSLARLPTSVLNAIKNKKTEAENKRSIEELKYRELKYRNLFENSLVGMFRANSKSCMFIEANEKAKKILGVESIDGILFDDFSLCNDQGTLSDHFRKNRMAVIEDFEVELIKPDRSKTWISVSAKLFETEEIIEGVIHDITNGKNSFVELEQINYELDRFTYHSSHDLRSPLRSLEGLVQAALEEDSIVGIKNCLKMMQKSISKMGGLIDDLLLIARNKKSEAKITSINFNQEVDESIQNLLFIEKIKFIEFKTSINQTSEFYTDAVRVRIVLNNIISNAIKYHRLDQENPFINIEVDVTSEKAKITIKDNGMGIADKHLLKVFDMFYRATNCSEGTGLGLFLVKSTIDKLGGEIKLTSELNKGTTFTIDLPNIPALIPVR